MNHWVVGQKDTQREGDGLETVAVAEGTEKRGWRRVLEQRAVGGPTEGSGEGEVPGQIQGRSGRL